MSLYIDKKYMALLAPKLDLCKHKSEFLWNFRCPLCGDSKKKKTKARGYVYRQRSNLFFSCHNCEQSLSIGSLIKKIDVPLFHQYQLEKYKKEAHSNVSAPIFKFSKPEFKKGFPFELPSIQSLPITHSAKKYVLKRKIPNKYFSDLYYADDFCKFVNEDMGICKKMKLNEPRIIIPFYDEHGMLLGIQGRALLNYDLKYITIKLDDSNIKVFGLNTVSFDKKVYVTEGPFDSMFLPNALATMDASLYNIFAILGKNFDHVLVFDNEPRNLEITKRIGKAISVGKNICIWPQNIEQKDVNDMVLTGLDVVSIIDSNTFSGPAAQINFNKWKRT